MTKFFTQLTSKSSDLADYGGKVNSLLNLAGHGLAVPKWVAVDVSFFSAFIKANLEQLNAIFSGIDFESAAACEAGSDKLKDYVIKHLLTEEQEKEITEYIADNFAGVKAFAVRSSAAKEDTAESSFAGLLNTYLQVDKKDLAKQVRNCFASLFNPGILKYCHLKGYKLLDLKMSVIVQVLVPADVAGVLFTANPQGVFNEMVAVAGLGLGEAVVSGRSATANYYINTTDKLSYFENAGAGNLLTTKQLASLLDLGLGIKQLYKREMDIEYAFYQDRLYVLQARPITTIKDEKQLVIDNSNIVESYPGISSPLTISFVQEAYHNLFKSAFKRIVKNPRFFKLKENNFANMVAGIKGRIYYNLTSWYGLLKEMPFSDRYIPVWEASLGISRFSDLDLKSEKLNSLAVIFRVLAVTWNIESRMKALGESFAKVEAGFRKSFSPTLNNSELFKLYAKIEKDVLKDWDLTLFNDVVTFQYSAAVKNTLQGLYLKKTDEVFNELLFGVQKMESVRPVESLMKMAELLNQDKQTLSALSILNEAKDKKQLESWLSLNQASDFAQLFNKHLEIYGDRSLEELKLESFTFRENKLLLLENILRFAASGVVNNQIHKSKAKHYKDALNKHFGVNIFLRLSFWNDLKKAGQAVANRESSRLNRARIYGMIRQIMLAVGHNLAVAGAIASSRDVFYLELNELKSGKTENFKTLIAQKKEQYQVYNKELYYSSYLVNSAGLEYIRKTSRVQAYQKLAAANALSGTGCAAGVVTGEVVIITDAKDPKQTKNIKNKIIVTRTTDPGWVFIISQCQGIIIEKGSMLSHTAIIARELGIPAIVNVKAASSVLKTGDIVTMDAGSGKIVIE